MPILFAGHESNNGEHRIYWMYFSQFVLMVACGSNQEKIAPEITTIRQSVYASATVQPDSLYQAYASVSGILDANKVAEGDTSNLGDTSTLLDPDVVEEIKAGAF